MIIVAILGFLMYSFIIWCISASIWYNIGLKEGKGEQNGIITGSYH